MQQKTAGMDKLKDAGQQLLKTLGDKAHEHRQRQARRPDRQARGHRRRRPASARPRARAARPGQGRLPVLGGLKGAASGIKDKITGGGGKGGGGGKATKSTNIIETIDVGVPVTVAYNQWTEFGAFPSFMKKVENVEAQDDNKIKFKAQIFLSHRTWEATILEQVPDERIVWRSKGEKGHVDGAVTFHEIGPNLTRILVVLEYYPQGLFEKTGNIWGAQGRRARAELRHFRRHVMTRTILHPDEIEGWRGTIEDGEVVETHEEAVEREEQEQDEEEQRRGRRRGRRGAEDEESRTRSPRTRSPRTSTTRTSRGGRGRRGRGRVRGRGRRGRGGAEDEEPEDEYEEEAEEEAAEDEYEEERRGRGGARTRTSPRTSRGRGASRGRARGRGRGRGARGEAAARRRRAS